MSTNPEQDRAALVAEKERANAEWLRACTERDRAYAEWLRADDDLAEYDRTRPAPETADATD